MDGVIYYYFGGGLVLAAVVLSYFGIRGKDSFPPSRGALAGLATAVAALVIGTAAFAVANAREEADHREAELAEEEDAAAEQQGEGAGAAPEAEQEAGVSEGGQPGGVGGGEAQTLDVTSPEDGSLVFDPEGLDAAAGAITLAYENPSPVPHNINLEVEGEPVAESDDITAGAVEISAELAPGEYIYFCSIPGHRESGMEGTLTVE